ncbi:MAG TPA: hypothetical protein VIH99_05400 [Bdellovibrionota bacterium]
MKSKILKLISSAAILGVILIEAKHSFVDRKPWLGFELVSNNVSYFLITLWLGAIVGLWTKRIFSFPAMFIGIFMIFAHSAVLSSGGNGPTFGSIYFMLGLIAGLSAVFAHEAFTHQEMKSEELQDRRLAS